MIPVVWLDARLLCWDQALVDDALSGRLWDGGHSCEHHTSDIPPGVDGVVLVVPARYHAAAEVNELIAPLRWVVIVATSDEEGTFAWKQLDHPNMRLWIQSACGVADRNLPVGYPTDTPRILAADGYHPPELDWFFAGQITHRRRVDCAQALRELTGGELIETESFTAGIDRVDYLDRLAGARSAPCPSGPVGTDTFRVWEALEAGTVPVADNRSPAMPPGYWDRFGTVGFPIISDGWGDVATYIDAIRVDWPAAANRASSWWQRWKRTFHQRLTDDITAVSGIDPDRHPVTVLIPTSPTPAHPAMDALDETLASVRAELGDVDVIVMCDGVRTAQEHRRAAYEEYVHRLCWRAEHEWRNVLPIVFDRLTHQADMTRAALDEVHTPLVMFVEHDTPLASWNGPTDWAAVFDALGSGEAKAIRLHHEASVLADHRHLMLDDKPRDIAGAPLLRTVQWSQRPHLATAGFYRWMLERFFPPGEPTMIEDVMHGVVHNEWIDFGLAGWDRFRLWMYAPEGNIQRSYHLDARGDDPKYVGA